jgi:GNAT superfamily N-acetyltransferase
MQPSLARPLKPKSGRSSDSSRRVDRNEKMLRIRPANPVDASQISTLITSLAHLFFASPDGRGSDKFREGITPQALAGFIVRPDITYLISEEDGVFCGAIALREHRHLHHLFVVPKFQGQGIGRQLWSAARDTAMAAGIPGEFTVNASLNAVPVYKRFGFESVGRPQQNSGLIFQQMKWTHAPVTVVDVPPAA